MVIAAISLAAWTFLRPNPRDEKEMPKIPHEMDIDAAFDEPAEPLVTTSPFESTPQTAQHLEDPTILEGLDDVLEETTGSKQEGDIASDLPSAPNLDEQKADLDLADIEALFEE